VREYIELMIKRISLTAVNNKSILSPQQQKLFNQKKPAKLTLKSEILFKKNIKIFAFNFLKLSYLIVQNAFLKQNL